MQHTPLPSAICRILLNPPLYKIMNVHDLPMLQPQIKDKLSSWCANRSSCLPLLYGVWNAYLANQFTINEINWSHLVCSLPLDKTKMHFWVQKGFVIPEHVPCHVHTPWSTMKGCVQHEWIILWSDRKANIWRWKKTTITSLLAKTTNKCS